MTTYDPDTLEQDHGILRKIVRELGGKIALDCAVASPGMLREGATISLSG